MEILQISDVEIYQLITKNFGFHPNETYIYFIDQMKFWLMKAADLGHAQAQARIGELYREGNFFEKDDKKAAHWSNLHPPVAASSNHDAKAISNNNEATPKILRLPPQAIMMQ